MTYVHSEVEWCRSSQQNFRTTKAYPGGQKDMTKFKKDLQVFCENIQPVFEEQFATTSKTGLAIAGMLTWWRFLLQKRLVASLEESLHELTKRRTRERHAEGHLSPGASVDAATAAAADSIAEDGSKHDTEAMAAAAAAGGGRGDESANDKHDREREKAEREAERKAHEREEAERTNKAGADSFAREESEFKARIATAIHRSNDELVSMGGMATLESCSKAARSISLELDGDFDAQMRRAICTHIAEELGHTVEEELFIDLFQCIGCTTAGFDMPRCGGDFDMEDEDDL